MIIYSIYKCVNNQTGKVYIGFDCNWPSRKRVHKSNYPRKKFKFYNAIRKYGWNSFDWQIIYQSLDRDYTLNVMENFFIQKYDSFKNGYNSTLGGEGVFGVHRKQSKEEKEKRRLLMKGNNYGSLSKGRKLSVESKLKMSLSKKGKPQPTMVCRYCNKKGSISGIKRYHMENCKLKI
jgi:group I intron endonuclease